MIKKNNHDEMVSVYITTHNRCDLLPRAIESVLNQSYKNIELIISNDGSSDDTESVIQKYIEDYSFFNIVYVKNELPLGANNARNRAINVATGTFVTGLDDDDEFLVNRVENFVINWNDKYSFICDNFLNDNRGSRTANYSNNNNNVFTIDHLVYRNEATNQIFTKLNRLKKICGFNETLRKYQDWECWLRLSSYYGEFRRFNWCSYVMHHDHEISRVSKNLSHSEAYEKIVSNNLDIYKTRSEKYVRTCLISRDMDINFSDVIMGNNFFEKRIMLKIYIRNFYNKVMRKY